MITSICGYEGKKGQISYAGSKAAVLGMTLSVQWLEILANVDKS
jgi:NAD(P)-dependent dehydrogenase (short-subunit alcohol dehydrogenase family)